MSFTAPVNVGNSPITGYQYQLGNGSWVAFASAPTGSPLTATIAGLTNGTTYAVHVRAINAIGDGDASTAVNVTPAAPQNLLPPAPTSAAAVAGVSSVTVTWTAPSPSTGVTGYTVLAQPGPATCSTSSVSITTCVIGATSGLPTATPSSRTAPWVTRPRRRHPPPRQPHRRFRRRRR